ncbi:OmpA family protein [Candidatus Liberibacter asiaticus]|uniref:OmpA/MotB n=2 Tax=Liberibacter asiaticus TaxID=34021 RepID=C6XGC3_LIBAP|nr:OmpA family protein [Candidatus Liberibacter asiaticus]ACT57426.1 OmpA/MotB [Candidatus Liberibacter asiaticus str. psy62]AGH17189.1 OmpA/MotB [Candidatus Liberibacter asiaticus str. gxpsy]ALK07492.1 OmpA family protein [Candidatus Liberibacter asiaticus]ASK52982.1 flagellar motor protein MotB [Candidatus Liberibacter asiaticus]AWL14309.1 OmpA family protein [Candidatus Liberibacter asiaticus]
MIKELGLSMFIMTTISGCGLASREKKKVFLHKSNDTDIVNKRFGSSLDKAEDEFQMQLQDTGIVVSRIGDMITCYIPVHVSFVSEVFLEKKFLPMLQLIATILNKFPSTVIAIQSHTDSIGTLKNNLLISQERADVIKSYLIQRGVSSNRFISVRGFAYKYPIDTNDTKVGRQNNQRIEIQIFPRGNIKK